MGVQQRWVFAALAFFAMAISSAMRTVLSIAITEMTLPIQHSATIKDNTCPDPEQKDPTNTTISSSNTAYNWDEHTQGIILSSFYWGYAAMNFVYGSLAERIGGKYLVGQAILIPAILTASTPFIISWGDSTALIALRILMGMSNSAMFPTTSTIVPSWTAPKERARYGSFIFTGFIVGLIVGMTLSGIIIQHFGWQVAFYAFGGAGIVWFPLWVVLVYDKPEDHPFVSDAEFEYLKRSQAEQRLIDLPPAPYLQILRSKEFWAFPLGLIGFNWANLLMISDLPKYMKSVVKFSVDSNGYLLSISFLCLWINSYLSTWTSQYILARNWMSRTNVRKLMTTLCIIAPSIFILAASYAECNKTLVVTMFIAGVTLMGSAYASIMVNNLDLSPNYAGTIMSIGNGISALVAGVFPPFLVGWLAPHQTLDEWRLVFWIGFAISSLTYVYVMIFLSGEVQKWDNGNFKNSVKAEKGQKS